MISCDTEDVNQSVRHNCADFVNVYIFKDKKNVIFSIKSH